MDVKCFDIFMGVVEDAAGILPPKMVCNGKKFDRMRRICNAIDKFAKAQETTFYDMSVDDSTFDIKITMDCDGIMLEDSNDKMYAVIGCARNFTIERGDSEDTIIFTLTFPSIWDVTED